MLYNRGEAECSLEGEWEGQVRYLPLYTAFRSPAGDDYRLCAGSPLIDASTNASAPVTVEVGGASPLRR